MKRFLKSKLVLFLATLLMLAAAISIPLSSTRSAFAAFSLDPSYGSGGKVITSFGDDASITALALQSDGKAVAVGYNTNGGHHNWAIARYNTNGGLDTSFGTNGIVTQDFGHDQWIEGAVAIQSDGKIVVGGTYVGGSAPFYWTIGRYNSDGSLDTSFGGSGIIANPIG